MYDYEDGTAREQLFAAGECGVSMGTVTVPDDMGHNMEAIEIDGELEVSDS